MKNNKLGKAAVLFLIMTKLLTGCGVHVEDAGENADTGKSMFVRVEATGVWDVVYHRDTKVMYAVSRGSYNQGAFTVLVNADGLPMTWDGE